MKLSPLLERKLKALQLIATNEPIQSLGLPGVRIKGTTNGSQGVTVAGRRFRRGKQAGLRSLGHNAALSMALKKHLANHGALVVRMVRVAPNRLDGDNLEAAFKRVRDGLAKCVGVDDRSPVIEYVTDDERGAVREYAVRFEVFAQPVARADGDDELRRKINAGPYAGRAPITDVELAKVRAETDRLLAAFPRSPIPNVQRPR